MAMPFSAIPTGIKVTIGAKSWWANCAWDALGIPVMFKQNATIHTTCPDCSEAIDLTVQDGSVTGNSNLIHFAVPAAHFWDNIVYT